MKKILILYSGGLDSKTMYHMAKKENPNDIIECVYYDYGNPVCEEEKKVLPDFVTIKKIEWFNNSTEKLKSKKREESRGNIYIPGRNLVFSILVASQELPDEIWLGATYSEVHDNATDKNLIFKEKTEDVLNYVLSPFLSKDLKIVYPFYERKMDKEEIISWMISNGHVEDVKTSISCYNPVGKVECGRCYQCLKKNLAAIKNKVELNFINNMFEDKEWLVKFLTELKEQSEKQNYTEKDVYIDMNFPVLYSIFKEKYNIDNKKYGWMRDWFEFLEKISNLYERIQVERGFKIFNF